MFTSGPVCKELTSPFKIHALVSFLYTAPELMDLTWLIFGHLLQLCNPFLVTFYTDSFQFNSKTKALKYYLNLEYSGGEQGGGGASKGIHSWVQALEAGNQHTL